MDAALFLLLVFPPPASGARVFAGLHGARARRAADRDEAAGMQRIDRDIVGGDVGGQLLRGPIGHRIDLDQRMRLVPGGECDVGAGRGMLAADAGDPALRAFQLAIERPDLPHLAAALAVLDRVAKTEYAVACDKLLNLTRVGRNEPDAQAVAELRQLDGLEHLGKQPAGIEGEDVDVFDAGLGDGVQDGLVLEPKAGREGDAPLDPAARLPDAVGERLDARKPLVELARLLPRRVAAKRQEVAIALLIVAAVARKRR